MQFEKIYRLHHHSCKYYLAIQVLSFAQKTETIPIRESIWMYPVLTIFQQ